MLKLFALATLLTGCLADVDAADDDGDFVDPETAEASADLNTTPGVNGSACIASPYNCRFHAGTGQRVMNGSSESWALTPGVALRDGNGTELGTMTSGHGTFNYGQIKVLAGLQHALLTGSSNASAAWYPISRIVDADAFRAADPKRIEAQDTGEAKLGCYEVRESVDTSISWKKVVKNTTSEHHDDLGDYLPLQRENGKRSVNIVFSVPGFSLGGATTDHVLTRMPDGSRTKFQRIGVPTDSGKPSISIPLWVKDAHGHYAKQSGTARFLYGYVKTTAGKRYGWMAQDALVPADSGCP